MGRINISGLSWPRSWRHLSSSLYRTSIWPLPLELLPPAPPLLSGLSITCWGRSCTSRRLWSCPLGCCRTCQALRSSPCLRGSSCRWIRETFQGLPLWQGSLNRSQSRKWSRKWRGMIVLTQSMCCMMLWTGSYPRNLLPKEIRRYWSRNSQSSSW